MGVGHPRLASPPLHSHMPCPPCPPGACQVLGEVSAETRAALEEPVAAKLAGPHCCLRLQVGVWGGGGGERFLLSLSVGSVRDRRAGEALGGRGSGLC